MLLLRTMLYSTSVVPFSPLLSFFISLADCWHPWWGCAGLISMAEWAAKLQQAAGCSQGVCCFCVSYIWCWGFRDFSEQSHYFSNPVQLCGMRKTCLWSTFFWHFIDYFIFLLCSMYSQNILYFLKVPCVYAQCMVNLIATYAVMWEMWDIFRKRKFRKWRLIWKSKAVHIYKAFLKNKWSNKSRKMFPIINCVNYYFITTKDIISSILTLHSESDRGSLLLLWIAAYIQPGFHGCFGTSEPFPSFALS